MTAIFPHASKALGRSSLGDQASGFSPTGTPHRPLPIGVGLGLGVLVSILLWIALISSVAAMVQ